MARIGSIQFRIRGLGFTLVELLVVIAVIGIVVSMLLPGIQAAREAARRMQCGNNLKQIGLALHIYESSHRAWPAQASGPTPGREFRARRSSWFTAILPLIEQNALYHAFNSNLHWHDSGNWYAVNSAVATFRCPSVPERQGFEWTVLVDYANSSTTVPTLTARAFYEGSVTDYTNVGGVSTQLNFTLVSSQQLSDPLNCGILKGTSVKLCEVTDGLSNTVLVTECAGRPLLYQRGRVVADGTLTKTWSGTASVNRPFPTGGVWASHNKGFIIDGAQSDGNTAIRPGKCSINCSNDNEVYAFHPGGAQTLFADGSLQFLSSSISIELLAALASRNGNEVVSPP